MLKNADYIYNHILRADEKNTTLDYCKKAQVGVDLSIRAIYKIKNYGLIFKDKTVAPTYEPIEPNNFDLVDPEIDKEGWFISKGTYIVSLNEGCSFGPNDTGLIIMRSSLNRSGVSVFSAVWDPGYSSCSSEGVFPMSVRITVDSEEVFIEKNARIAQLIVFENEDTSQYDGQWMGGRMTSKLENKNTYSEIDENYEENE